MKETTMRRKSPRHEVEMIRCDEMALLRARDGLEAICQLLEHFPDQVTVDADKLACLLRLVHGEAASSVLGPIRVTV